MPRTALCEPGQAATGLSLSATAHGRRSAAKDGGQGQTKEKSDDGKSACLKNGRH
jgi:hypothetical protein